MLIDSLYWTCVSTKISNYHFIKFPSSRSELLRQIWNGEFVREISGRSRWGKICFPRNYLHNGIGASKPWSDTWNADARGRGREKGEREFSAESNWRSGTEIIAFTRRPSSNTKRSSYGNVAPACPPRTGGLVFMNEIHYAWIRWRDLCLATMEKSQSYPQPTSAKRNEKLLFYPLVSSAETTHDRYSKS